MGFLGDDLADDLTPFVIDGLISVRVTPKAAQNRLFIKEGKVRVYVTAVPENGKANKAVQKILAKSLGLAKTNLELVRGSKDRDKVFRVFSS